ncbi:MAG TPA: hypothetical protein VLI39_19990 [Sedimentisphaerales bacterium]|nr:hypothetical protein [Sedimentisphaerales bacterium]
MPRENSAGLAALDALEHLVEDRPAGRFRGLAFDEDVGDFEAFALRELLDLGELVGNRADLPRGVIGGLARVDKKAWRVHGVILLARPSRRA